MVNVGVAQNVLKMMGLGMMRMQMKNILVISVGMKMQKIMNSYVFSSGNIM